MQELQTNVELIPAARQLPLWRFSLAELMLFITVVAGCSACWLVHPLVTVGVGVLMVPILIRTLASNRVALAKGDAPKLFDQVQAFCSSCFLSLVAFFYFAVIVSGATFLSAFAVGPGAVGIGVLAAIYGARIPYRILKDTWPK